MTVLRFLRIILAALRPYRGDAMVIAAGLTLEMAINALVPLSFRTLVDDVLPSHDEHLLLLLILVLSAGAILLVASGLARDWLYARLAARVVADLRAKIFSHLQLLSKEFYDRTDTGQIVARFATDLSAVETSLASASWGILAGFDVAMTVVLLFVLDWRLALVSMLIWPLTLAGPRAVESRATAAAYRHKESEGDALATVQEHASAQLIVKAFGVESEARQSFAARNDALMQHTLRVRFFGALMDRTASLGILVMQIVVLAVGARMAFSGALTVGRLVAFQALFLTLSYGLYNLAQFSPQLVQASAGMQRVEELLQERPSVVDASDATPLPRLTDRIALRGVSFAYVGRERVLHAVDLEIPRGSYVAIVGASGSGKSTVVSMLLRFHDPESGVVLFDGRDVRTATQASLRSHLGVVFQENLLFDQSIRENIRMGRPSATDAEVQAATRAAEVHDFIATLPNGYDERVGERGSLLSGGQRQRIAIARAIVRDPAVLLLDEATSALDPPTEAAINATIAKLAGGRTVVAVTHRLSAVTLADCIYVMERGRVVERGRHGELLARDGAYARLWEKQTGLFMTRPTGEIDLRPAGLRRVRLLERLDAEQLKALEPYLIAETFPHERVIVREGDPGDRLYVLLRGRVEVMQSTSAGDQRVAILEDGDYFGELALLDDAPRGATVRAITFCTCLTLARSHFLELLDRYPQLRAEVTALADRRRVASALLSS